MESIEVRDVYVGSTATGERISVDVRLTVRKGEGKHTTAHEPAPAEFYEFSASGESTLYGRYQSGGQMLDDLLTITKPARGLTPEDIRDLHTLWQDWHLNDLTAACDHMPADAYKRYSEAGEKVACPDTGYTYGHAWLVRVIPDDTAADMRRMIEKLRS